jgi:hypothetical protein
VITVVLRCKTAVVDRKLCDDSERSNDSPSIAQFQMRVHTIQQTNKQLTNKQANAQTKKQKTKYHSLLGWHTIRN